MNTPVEGSPVLPSFAGSALVDDLCSHLEANEGTEGPLLCDFAREFFTKVPRQLAQDRSMEDLAALTVGAFRFLKKSRPDVVNVEVIEPEEEGWSAPVTVIRAELGDRPFIVDTIREYLSAENVPIQRFIHPVLGLVRNAAGAIQAVGPVGEGTAESLVHCEIARIDDPKRRDELCREIERRLKDVVAATGDFKAMLAEVEETIRTVRGYESFAPEREAEFREIEDFLRWLEDGNFVFMGYRAYDIGGTEASPALEVEHGSGLGILRQEEKSTWAGPVRLSEISEQLRRRVVEGPLLIVSKTNAESPVHRRARMDYIGVKKLDSEGNVVGERRFLGLFTSKAYAEHADVIPILREKLAAILRESAAQPESHDYKEIITIFNSMPKEELFQASVAELHEEVQTVLGLLFSDEVQVSLRPDPLGRGVSVMVILPRGKFSSDVRHRIQDALVRRFEGNVLNYHLAMSASDQARLHFYLSAPAEVARSVDTRELEHDVRQIIRSWEDRLREELTAAVGEAEAQRLSELYGPAFSDEYRAANLPEVALQDVLELERMRREEHSVAVTLREPRGRGRAEAFRGVTVLKLYLYGERLVLSDFMPILDNAGLRVVEVTPFVVAGDGLSEIMIYAFAVQDPEGNQVPMARAGHLAEMILAVRAGDMQNDPYNALVLAGGLRSREVDVLRTYANYAF
ncbi:MAG TPA: hypothetical protein VFI96_03550, partial [Longimicrobiaceae bacterium]|nr:hypothetical protein [Longimicrobiaceae bacterium]